jgi:hypothetical protein
MDTGPYYGGYYGVPSYGYRSYSRAYSGFGYPSYGYGPRRFYGW